ncbi:hypothetical protein GCM10028778_07790 [Barrientosiimonas marina]|uniref:Lipoprotein n=1 Tax=Lentibacillus kimchii TaxID=1542911 RepID=A0ABW2UZX4_9BACI
MKKKAALLSMFVLVVAFLSACTNNSDNSTKPDRNSLVFNIENQANFGFNAIEISTDKSSGGGISYADGSKIKKGDTLRKRYNNLEDLEGEATFKFVLLIGDKKQRVPLKEITLDLAANKEYSFEITGDLVNQARLKRIN